MKFSGIIFVANDSLYENIMKLHLSSAIFQHNITIVSNTARQIFYGSHVLIRENTTLNVSFNTAYMITQQTLTASARAGRVCGA